MRRMPHGPYIFYGLQLSLYAGKVRSYLRKKRLPFLERETWHPGFAAAAARVATAKQPMIETPDGEIIQDTTEIIDFLEARHPGASVYPEGPVQGLVALLFELYGDEGLMKPAMHYRWNFPEDNDDFLMAEFGRGLSPAQLAADGEPGRQGPEAGLALAAGLRETMRNQVIPELGVTAESAPAIEAAYEDLLDRLEDHFHAHPYLLGGRPSIGDFGMIAPLYAHLGRDPHPLDLMKRRAPSCHRWVERMNVSDSGMAEFPDVPEAFLPGDEVPETLLPILALMAQDYMPELLGIVAFVNRWVADQPEVAFGSAFPASTRVMGTSAPLGSHRVTLRGVKIELAVQHYSIWMLQRVLDHYHGLDPEDRRRADDLLAPTGLAPLLAARPARRIERVGFTEVFA